MSSLAGSFSSEYDALTKGCGCTPLTRWSTVTLTGSDRHTFLHNMCSNDIRRLKVGQGCEAFCTDVKGRLVAHIGVHAMEDRLELLTVPDQATPLTSHLDRYIIREDVQLHDHTAQRCWWLISGGKSRDVLASLARDSADSLQEDWQNITLDFNGKNYALVRCELLWPGGYLLQCQSSEQATLLELLESAGATECTPANSSCCSDAVTSLRVESGFPLLGIDFSGENLPQEVDRDVQAINFNKGCYLGQETIARIDALGHVNRKLVTIQFTAETVPPVGSALRHLEKDVGKVTSACWSPRTQSPLALAMVRRGSNAIGTKLESDIGSAIIVASGENAS